MSFCLRIFLFLLFFLSFLKWTFTTENQIDGLYNYHVKKGFAHYPQLSALSKNNFFNLNFNLFPNVFWQAKLSGLFLLFESEKFLLNKITSHFKIDFIQYNGSDFFHESQQQVIVVDNKKILLNNNFAFQVHKFYFGFNFNFEREMIGELLNRNTFAIDFGIMHAFKNFNFFLLKEFFLTGAVKNIFNPLESIQFNTGIFGNCKKIKINQLNFNFSFYLGTEIESYTSLIFALNSKVDFNSYSLIFNSSFKNFNLQQNRFSLGCGIEIEKNILIIGVEEFITDFYRYGVSYQRGI